MSGYTHASRETSRRRIVKGDYVEVGVHTGRVTRVHRYGYNVLLDDTGAEVFAGTVAYLPDEEEIRRECERIRAERWSANERESRYVGPRPTPADTPIVSLGLLPWSGSTAI